jgi:hypothetical protein
MLKRITASDEKVAILFPYRLHKFFQFPRKGFQGYIQLRMRHLSHIAMIQTVTAELQRDDSWLECRTSQQTSKAGAMLLRFFFEGR